MANALAAPPAVQARAASTAADRIRLGLTGVPLFDWWAGGLIGRDAYAARLDEIVELGTPVLSRGECLLSARMWWQPGPLVERTLTDAVAGGLLPHASYDVARFVAFRAAMAAGWDHANRVTFIFPEEAQLLFAVADIVRPRRIAVLGSYYGYWAAWALAGAGDALREAVLIDVDPTVTALAAANLDRLGFAGRARAVQADAITAMAESDVEYDLIVLDAEAPSDHPDPRMCGKAIYGPIAETALPRLRPGGVLVAHNILLDRTVAHPAFLAFADYTSVLLAEFLVRVRHACRAELSVATTEGVGLYLK